MTAATVDFYFGLTSRYSYLAQTQVPRIAAETGVRFNWKPLYSPDLMDRRGQNPFRGEPPSGAYDFRYRLKDLERWADHYGAAYNEPDGRLEGDRRLFALAAVAGAALGRAEDMSRVIFKAVFVDDREALERNDLVDLAVGIGLEREAFAAALRATETWELHDRHLDEAIAAGVFGVPTFISGGELWFGNDRLVLLEEWLKT